jgi:putative inorganic carbon (HCO3(-)) transporter
MGVGLYALTQEHAIFKAIAMRSAFQPGPAGVYRRMTGPYENPIDLATYLMVAIPLMLGLVWHERRWRKAALGVLLTLLAVCMIRTASLGAVTGLWIGLLVMATATWGIRRVALPFVGASLAAGLLMWWSESRRLMQWLSGVGLGDRWAMWQAALGMMRDRPLLGHGINTFMSNYLRYWVGGEQAPRYAHNCYLQVAAETGVIGLISFLWLLGALFHLVVRGVRQAVGDDKALLIGLLGGLSAFAVHAAVDTNFYSLRQAALFWVLGGVAVGMSERILRECDAPPPTAAVPAAQRPIVVA